jgi:hypothetical protein
MLDLDSSPRGYDANWCSLPLNWKEIKTAPRLEPNTWVKLLTCLNPFCYDEALLLCQESESEWVAWIPDHGEAVLHVNQFCLEESL